MAKSKRKANKITKSRLNRMFRDFKIRECFINLTKMNAADDDVLADAILRKYRHEYRIRNCCVHLNRLNKNDLQEKPTPEEKIYLTPKMDNARSFLIPTPVSVQKRSEETLYALKTHRERNGIEVPIPVKNIKRYRSKFILDAKKNIYTMDDMHQELSERMKEPGKGLKPSSARVLQEQQPQPISDAQKILNELKAKVYAKKCKHQESIME